MNILKKYFGEDSIHYESFKHYFDQFDGNVDIFLNCRGILIAAKEL